MERRLVALLVLLLLGLHAGLAWSGARQKSLHYDEIAHLAAGVSYWKTGDVRLHPENGNLPQRLIGLPVALSRDVALPPFEGEEWNRSDVWEIGDALFHRLGNDGAALLRRGRAPVMLLSVLLCFTVFLWSRRLFGTAGGLLSLFLAAVSPTLLAHGRIMTSDTCLALFFLWSLAGVASLLQRVTLPRVLGSTLAVAGLFLCKTSAAVLLPVAAILAGIGLWSRRPLLLGRRAVSGRGGKLAVYGGLLVLHALVAAVLIWTACGFHFAPAGARTSYYKLKTLSRATAEAGTGGRVLQWLGDRRVLPEPYLYGAAFTLVHAQQRRAFLNGEYSLHGWWYYLPYCMLVKTPLPLLGILAVAALAAVRRRRAAGSGALPLAVFFAVYGAVALTSDLNIGHRHALPLEPVLLIAAGASARVRGVAGRGALGLLLAASGVEAIRAHPHTLAYFNGIVARETAYRHLADSNLDWGQDLPALAAWLEDHDPGAQPVALCYFGKGSPAAYGIEARRIDATAAPREALEPLEPGLYCVSATALDALYGDFPGRWNRDYEERYQGLVPVVAQLRQRLGPDRAAAPAVHPDLDTVLHGYAQLRTARLLAFLRQRDPDDRAAYSILMFRLTAEDLEAALEGPPAELDELSWIQSEQGG